jgi:hypothetical protein
VPIPPLSPHGLLPDGLHECTLDELVETFGSFQESDRRPSLARELNDYMEQLRSAGVGKYLVVDGSFVTSKPKPSDVDILLILRDNVTLTGPIPPFQYNARSRRYVRKNFNFDFFVGFEGDPSATEILALFHKVKYRPGETKGVLKVTL